MASDLKRAKRIAHVLNLFERVSRNELAACGRALADARRSHEAAMASLASEDFLGGAFGDFVTRQLPKLSATVERRAQAYDAAAQNWRGRHMRLQASTERVAEARERAAKDLEARDIEGVLDALLRAPTRLR